MAPNLGLWSIPVNRNAKYIHGKPSAYVGINKLERLIDDERVVQNVLNVKLVITAVVFETTIYHILTQSSPKITTLILDKPMILS